uniref:Uncharacterized protein n=1 Tax=Anguilla anguilla TaxID=7936 RepID=A0A0E9Q6C3_ANGAN
MCQVFKSTLKSNHLTNHFFLGNYFIFIKLYHDILRIYYEHFMNKHFMHFK